MDLHSILTPALVLDVARLRRNAAVMSQRMKALGVKLRPHMKTAKSDRVAAIATAGWDGGVTVSTLAEARYFATHGYRDITLAIGIVPAKLAAVAELQESGARVQLLTDNPTMATAAAAFAGSVDQRFEVLIEIDSGQHRAGVAPDSPVLLEIGRLLHEADGTTLAGVLTHAGHAYHCHGREALEAVAEAERAAVVTAAERLRAAGLPCPVVSAGSTPTAAHARTLDGVTEMRPGVYMFGDLDQYGIGSCQVGDIAVSVLASVIGRHDSPDRLLVDSGALALSKDQLATEFVKDAGFGWVCDVESLARLPGLRVAAVDQEHGFVDAGGGPLAADGPELGGRVRVLPNHACITAAAYDRYYVVDSSRDPTAVIDVWDRVIGW